MTKTGGSAAIAHAVPESAEMYRPRLAEARRAAEEHGAALARACACPDTSSADLIRASDAVLDAASRLRGLAALVRRLS